MWTRLKEAIDSIFPYITHDDWGITDEELDAEYLMNWSGQKIVSPRIGAYYELNEYEPLTEAQLTLIGSIISSKYGIVWHQLAQALLSEYDPAEAINVTEEFTGSESRERTPDLTRTRTPNLTTVETPAVVNTTEDSVSAFNSSSYQPSNKTVNTPTGTNTTNSTGSETNTETGTDETSVEKTEARTRTGSETPRQEEYEKEILLRKHNFFDIVFSNLDDILTLDIY